MQRLFSAGMVRVMVNRKPVSVPAGSNLVKACEAAGISLPMLCYHPSIRTDSRCNLCLVEVRGVKDLVRACDTKAAEGMSVTTDSPRVIQQVTGNIKKILKHHSGDCTAPCQIACPTHIDIMGYIHLASEGRFAEALELIKRQNPLPLSCGFVCPAFCEMACRRNLVDAPVNINHIKRYVAELNLSSSVPYTPKLAPRTGKKVRGTERRRSGG